MVLLDEFLAAKGMQRDVENIRREHIETFQADQLTRLRPASAGVRRRSLKEGTANAFHKMAILHERWNSERLIRARLALIAHVRNRS